MIPIRFEPELYQQLLSEAKRRGTSIPALVNKLLKTILNNEELNEQNGTITKTKNR